MEQSLVILLKRLWGHINQRHRSQFGLLLVLILIASFLEIVSIGAVLPFLGVLTMPERIFELPYAQPVILALKLTNPSQLLLPLTIAFGLTALIAGVVRMLLLWASTRLSFAAGADLSINIYRRTLYQAYEVHCARNSSEVINGISGKANGVIYSVIMPALTILSSTVLLISILITLLLIDPTIALTAFSAFGLIYLVIIRMSRKRLSIGSQTFARESTHVIQLLQEGLGGIRDVLIDGSQSSYCEIYRNADLRMRRAQADCSFIATSPRYALETLGMLLMATLAYYIEQQPGGLAKGIPILGALALGAQRLLPALQQVYGSWTQINSNRASLQDVLKLLDQPLPFYADQPAPKALPFERNISLKGLSFRYSLETPYVLNQLSLTIPKGARIGFIGKTGSGKSTLLDIVMGLLQPTNGALEIDDQVITPANNRAWQAHIAHVPQAIFLVDATIEKNIAFGVSEDQIDYVRVREAAEQAQISDTIESWAAQYKTLVGEHGIRLSGGQRQRIGIARALYKKADVIIFDEATSALDYKTEQAIMKSIEGLSKELTILIIAHRLSTLENCTHIIDLSEGRIKQAGSYQDIINNTL